MSEAVKREELGFDKAPTRYMTSSGREVIDLIRDAMDDESFVAYCMGCAIAYRFRDPQDPRHTQDGTKADFYEAMALHVYDPDNYADPREYRTDHQPYVRQPMSPDLFELYHRQIGQNLGTIFPLPK